MTTAQPGQEQRMELVERAIALREECRKGVEDRGVMPDYVDACVALKALAPALLGEVERLQALTRPTADLGEDGELDRKLRGFATAMREYKPTLVSAGYGGFAFAPSDYEAIADRLILYREALAKARDKFLDYAAQHEAKARAANPGGSGRSMDGEAADRWKKSESNREMADMLSALLSRSGDD